MNCEECSGLLIDYLEDILSPEESGAVKEHLEGCPDCSLELEHYKEIRTAAREEAIPEVSAETLSSLSETARKMRLYQETSFLEKVVLLTNPRSDYKRRNSSLGLVLLRPGRY